MKTKILIFYLFFVLPCALVSYSQTTFSDYFKTEFLNASRLYDSALANPGSLMGPFPYDEDEGSKEMQTYLFQREKFYPSGNFRGAILSDSMLALKVSSGSCSNANWQLLGPIGDPLGPTTYPTTANKNGRLDCIAFKPGDTTVLYVGSGGGGGLWKVSLSTSTATSLNTDRIALHTGVGSVATVPGRIVIATGKSLGKVYFDEWQFTCTGIYFTNNEGVSWIKSTVTDKNGHDPFLYGIGHKQWVSKIVVKPNNPSIMFMTVYNETVMYSNDEKDYGALFKSIDSGATWTEVNNSSLTSRFFTDVEFNPLHPDTLYVCGHRIYRSNDDGANWTDVTNQLSGLPSRPGTVPNDQWANYRMYIAVPSKGCILANTDHIAVFVQPGPDGRGGNFDVNYLLYHSADALNSSISSIVSTTPIDQRIAPEIAIPYHMGFTMSQDPNILYIAGAIVQRSNDGGASFVTNNIYNGSTHADIQEIGIPPFTGSNAGIAFICTDGGLWRTNDTGKTFYPLNNGLTVTEFYGVNVSQTDNTILAGAQDNYVMLKGGDNIWHGLGTGDGSRYSAVNSQNTSQIGFSDLQYHYSVHGPFGGISTTYGNPMRPIMYLLNSKSTFLAATDRIYKITNGIETIGEPFKRCLGADSIYWVDQLNTAVSFGYCDADTNVVYLSTEGQWDDGNGNLVGRDPNVDYGSLTGHLAYSFFKSTDGGSTWNDISLTLGGIDGHISSVAVHPHNPNQLWITRSGYVGKDGVSHTSVYYSDDGGMSWTAYNDGLPYGSAKKIIYQRGTNNLLYLAMESGIYYRDSLMSSWECFDNGMPITNITDIDISYCTGKLYASTFGRGIWQTDLFHNSGTGDDLEITSNITWDRDLIIQGNVHIKAGGVLNIQKNGGVKPKIYMPKNSSIIVDIGGQLNIDGAILTNGCENCQWQGIVLKGDPSHGQNMPFHYQGNAIINDAQIEHAITAIDAGYGGAVWATNTFFYNNSRSAYLHDYIKVPGAKFNGLFKQCTFQVDPNFKGGSAHPFTCHIELYDVDQPNVIGCSFYNRFDFSDSRWGTGQGIKVKNAGVNVYRYCSNPLSCTSPTNNLFIGLRSGIEINNVWAIASRVSNSTFDSCTFGINIHGDHLLTTFNTFNVGRGREINLGNVDCHRNVGFYAVAGYDGMILENNTFNGYTWTANSPDFKSIGALYENCSDDGGSTKQTFLNSFNNLSIAAKGWGQNHSPIFTVQPNGLLFYCNTFSGNNNDIVASPMVGVTSGRNGISPYQGTRDTAAGNLFNSITNTNLYDNGTFGYDYFWGSGSPAEFPTNANPSSLKNPSASYNSRNCTTHYTAAGNNMPLPGHNPGPAKWPAFDGERVAAINVLDNLIDGGNTGALLGYLGGKSIMDSASVYATVHDYSPYVSGDALKSIAINNLLSPGRLTMLLKENPERLLDQDFLDFLDNSLTPDIYNTTDITSFASYAATNKTDMTDRLAKISYLRGEEQMAQDMGVFDLLFDSTGANQDSVLAWYDHMNTVSAEYAKVEYLYGAHSFTTGDAILSNIPTKFSLTTEQTTEHGIYTKVYQVITDAYAAGRSLAQLTTSEEDSITTWVSSGSANFRSIYIPPIIVQAKNPNVIVTCDMFVGKSGITDNDNSSHNDNKLTNGKLRVYPNPAKDHVTFEYSFDNLDGNLTLTVTNIVGQKIYEKDITESVGKTEWDTRSVTSGVYTYKLMNGHSVLNVGKVVITK